MQLHKLERPQNTERCGQCYFVFSLRASSSGCYGDGESLQPRLWNLKSTSNFPVAPRRLSCQISANQRDAETNANVNKHWKKQVPMVMRSLLMSSPLISISHRLFRRRYSNSRDVVPVSPSFSRPAVRAYWQAILFYVDCITVLFLFDIQEF